MSTTRDADETAVARSAADVDAFVRLECGSDGRERPTLTHGQVLFVPPDAPARVLFAFDHVEVRRARRVSADTFETLKSVGYLPRDLVTGEYIDEHVSPLHGKRERIHLFSARGIRMRYSPSGLRWMTISMRPEEVPSPFRLVWTRSPGRSIASLNFSLWVPDDVGARSRVETISHTFDCDTAALDGDAPYVPARISNTLLCDSWVDPATGDSNGRMLITRSGRTLESMDALPKHVTAALNANFPKLLEPLSWD